MTRLSPDLRSRHLRTYRVLLGLVSGTGVALAFFPTPATYDPFGPRLALSGFALAGLAASYRPWARDHLRRWVMATGYLLLGWFLYIGSQNGLGIDNAVGLVPIVLLVPLVVRHARELLVYAGIFVFGTILAYNGNLEPALPLPVALLVHGSLALGLGGTSLSRARLEEALHTANSSLESRVAARTTDLADANARLRGEV